MQKIVEKLIKMKKTISTMESCTGGLLASEITNISGSSEIFQLGLVTYSNEYKVKFGIQPETIKKYTVYSEQIAEEMARSIQELTQSDFAIGITGQFGKEDPNNMGCPVNKVYVSIYDKEEKRAESFCIPIQYQEKRNAMKEQVIKEIEIRLWNRLEKGAGE